MSESQANPTPSRARRAADHGAALLWIIVGGFACAQMTPLEPSLLEEGYIVHIAQRLVSGEHLYRDIITFTGPLPFEFLALLFRVFGERIEVARWAVTLLHALSCGAAFALVRRASPGWPAHAATAALACAPVLLFPLHSMYFYSTLAGSLVYFAGYAALRGLRSVPWAVTAGVLVAGIALTKQNIGAVLALGLLIVMLRERGRTAKGPGRAAGYAFAGGGFAVTGLTIAAYSMAGDLGALFHSLVILPLSLHGTFSSPFLNLWPPGTLAPEILANNGFYFPFIYSLFVRDTTDPGTTIVLLTQLLYSLPFLAAGLTIASALRRPLPPATWIHTAILVAVGASLFPRTDWGHLVFVLPSAVVQLMMLIQPAPESRTAIRFVRKLIPAGLLGLLLVGTWIQATLLLHVTDQGSWGPKVTQRPISRSLRGDQIPQVIRYLRARTQPGEPIFVARAEPLLYFATDTTNPTPYGGVIPGLSDEQQDAILEGLEGVRFVVMSEIDHPFFTYYRDELPRVEAYLERHFQIARPFVMISTQLIVLERGRDRGATAIDLMSQDIAVRAFVRDASGMAPRQAFELPKLPTHHNRRPHPFSLGAFGGGLDYDLVVPPDAWLQLTVGISELVGQRTNWVQPANSEVVVSISDGDGFEELTRVPILGSAYEARRWVPIDLDLSKWQARMITLRLELQTQTVIEADQIGWFGSPRIVIVPPDADWAQ